MKTVVAILLLCGVAYAGEPAPLEKFDALEWRALELVNGTVDFGRMADGRSEADRQRVREALENVIRHAHAVMPEPAVVIPTAPSPTGHTPRLLWSREQQAVWDRMRAESHPWMTWLLERSRAAKNYPDNGAYQVLGFQITGDRELGRRAWEKIRPVITVQPTSANAIRETFIEYVLWRDWLTPVLTEDERATYDAGLNGWALYALGIGTPKYVGGFGVADSDQTVGQYLGLRMLDNLTGSKWCEQLPVDVRPAIERYCEFAKGGEWIESASYNAGTSQLIAMGVAALGDEAEPELAKYLDEAALACCYRITPDLRDSYLWGDEEHGHAAFPSVAYKYETLFCLLSHRNPHLHSLIADLSKEYPDSGYPSARPWWRAFYLWSPYRASEDWRALPPIHFSAGQGILTYKDADTLFVAHCPPRMLVHHEVSWASDFQLYQDGEWQVGHPTAYSLIGPANTLLLYGQQSMHARGWTDWRHGDGWCEITCNTSGPFYVYGSYPKLYYDPPPAFVEKAQRTIRFEGGKITLTDDVRVTPPTRLERYRAIDRERFTDVPVSSVIYQGAELVTRTHDVEVAR